MASARHARRNRVTTWAAAIAAPLLVVVGLTMASWDAGSEDTPARRSATASNDPTPTTASLTGPSPVPTARRVVIEGRPEVVAVPALGIRAEVDPIAVEAGALNPPSDPGRIGWWADGARPGARHGKAVLTGHTVRAGGGALDDLETLATGEKVVIMSTGGRVTYEVISVRVLSREQLARQNRSIFAPDGPHRLVLITCEDWDGVAYRSNVVVEARPRR